MPDLPTGTVTFLFTDIEGSTRLWEEHPEAMAAALARHDLLAASIIDQHTGTVVKHRGEGDSLFAVFPHATVAVAAATTLQRSLAAEPWPEQIPLRVRIALHQGEATLRDGDYFGAAVNRCARLRSAAHGGQILLPQAVCDLVRDTLPAGVTLRELGAHRLKDLQQPEHLYQLLHPDLPADFPPLRSLEAFSHNLTRQLTSFVGREWEMTEVKRLLATTTLLTLTGSGGSGKTRLALQVAADRVEEFTDGVWLVELAAVSDPALGPQTVASALGVREESGRPLESTLTDYLRPRSLLLLLDNCEHLLTACARLAEDLLRTCPHLKILASSREGLGITGETIYRLPSLTMPDPRGRAPRAEDLTEYDAVRLFVDRATAAAPSFTLTEENAPAVATVCHRLDGIPLAIELAAARVRVLPVEQIAERLDDRFRLLTGGSRTALPRQQTLRALIDWSYDLLSPPERTLLWRLAVFAGGWTLEAAEAVCAGDGIEEWEVLDLLIRLTEKSLVVCEERDGRARYHLLETLRQYARDRLLESGEAERVRGRQRDWVLALAEQDYPGFFSHEAGQTDRWLDRLEAEHDNLRAALEWCLEAEQEATTGLRLISLVWQLWELRGYWREGHEWVERILIAAPVQTAPVRSRALLGAGLLAGDPELASCRLEEALALYRDLTDEDGTAMSLLSLGTLKMRQSEGAQAQALMAESLGIWRKRGNARGMGATLVNLGCLARERGDYAAARSHWEECLTIVRREEGPGIVALALSNLAGLARMEKDYASARRLTQEALQLRWSAPDRGRRIVGTRIAELLRQLGSLAVAMGEVERGVRLMSAAERLHEEFLDIAMDVRQRRKPSRAVSLAMEARAALSEQAFAAAWEEGRAMTLEQVVAYALEETSTGEFGKPQ